MFTTEEMTTYLANLKEKIKDLAEVFDEKKNDKELENHLEMIEEIKKTIEEVRA